MSGVHIVRIRYCLCGTNPLTSRSQLIRARWFPATWSRPNTVFTFCLLDFLHKLQAQDKVNIYDFYASLVPVSNVADSKPLTVCPFPLPINLTYLPQRRHRELLLVLKIWAHMRRVPRGGVSYVSGVKALGQGLLAMEYAACLHPGNNLASPVD